MLKSKAIHLTLLFITLNIAYTFSQSSTKKQAPNFDLLYQKGMEYFEQKDYVAALNNLQQADILNPNHYKLATCLGFTCKELNLYASAIGYFENALSIDNRYSSLGNLAAVYAGLGRYDLALEYVDKTLSENPSYTHALINKSSILIERGEYDEALAILNKAIDTDSPLPATFFNIGVVYKRMGQSENSLLYLDKALALDPTYNECLLLKANELKGLGKPKTSYQALCDTIIKEESYTLQKNTQNYKSLYFRASAYYLLGKNKLMSNDLNSVIDILNNLTPLYPEASALFSWRAKMYYLLGDTDSASLDYHKVLELEPENISAKKYFENKNNNN